MPDDAYADIRERKKRVVQVTMELREYAVHEAVVGRGSGFGEDRAA